MQKVQAQQLKSGTWFVVDYTGSTRWCGSQQEAEAAAKQINEEIDQLDEREFWRENKREIAILTASAMLLGNDGSEIPETDQWLNTAAALMREIVRRGGDSGNTKQ